MNIKCWSYFKNHEWSCKENYSNGGALLPSAIHKLPNQWFKLNAHNRKVNECAFQNNSILQ